MRQRRDSPILDGIDIGSLVLVLMDQTKNILVKRVRLKTEMRHVKCAVLKINWEELVHLDAMPGSKSNV